MQVDLSTNFFELFGFEALFDIDKATLDDRWQSLQRTLHPDKFVSSSDAERRYSMQAASMVNEAHKVLSTPLSRAGYLLKLKGVDLDVETDTKMSGEFLMDQMELREQIDDLQGLQDPYVGIDNLRKTLKHKEDTLADNFAKSFGSNDLPVAREKVREWQFIDKLKREISDIEAVLDDR